jgi:hypothetical protein
LTSVSEAVVQSLHVAIALAARSNARYRSSSILGDIDPAVTMSIYPFNLVYQLWSAESDLLRTA